MSDAVKILIVDDEPDMLSWLEGALEQPGYEIKTSLSFSEAIEAINSFKPTLVLSDLMLGNHGGIELLTLSKNCEKPPVFVFLSGFGTIEYAVKSMKEGAFNFLTKPIEEKELLKVIAEALESAKNPGAKSLTYNPNVKLRDELESREREMIIQALKRNSWIKSKAAVDLGLEPSHLHYKIKKYNISSAEEPTSTAEVKN